MTIFSSYYGPSVFCLLSRPKKGPSCALLHWMFAAKLHHDSTCKTKLLKELVSFFVVALFTLFECRRCWQFLLHVSLLSNGWKELHPKETTHRVATDLKAFRTSKKKDAATTTVSILLMWFHLRQSWHRRINKAFKLCSVILHFFFVL